MESVKTPVKTLGVTGGIGSGKSAVCKELEELGAAVFSADQVAKHIMVSDPGAREEIIHAFGAESYLPDGALNRAYLAQTVFGDEAQVATINGIVHPRVFQAFQEQKKHCKAPLLVHEAALIFESGGYKHLDAVLVVHAPLEIRIQRVIARDGASRQHVLDRMGHQLPAEELLRRADYVINNDSDLDTLRQRVQEFYNLYVAIK
ncbi:MAG: dephospho-CoA kinase [Rhodothermaceae bacterium]|nr:dephospho-CoA kinase [Rhodothermaceae bacterium]